MAHSISTTTESSIAARRVHFSSAHFYHQPTWSDDKNREVFGRCFTPYGHGHNYLLEVFVRGPIDPHTQLVINLSDLDRLLKEVIRRFDHQHLNFDVPEFQSMVPTTENLAHVLHTEITRRLDVFPKLQLEKIRLYESDSLWVEVN